jgi:hypothetical protein
MTPLTPEQLRSPVALTKPAIMLETLKLAYSHQLDEVDAAWGAPSKDRRLTCAEQLELGRRLAAYHLL